MSTHASRIRLLQRGQAQKLQGGIYTATLPGSEDIGLLEVSRKVAKA